MSLTTCLTSSQPGSRLLLACRRMRLFEGDAVRSTKLSGFLRDSIQHTQQGPQAAAFQAAVNQLDPELMKQVQTMVAS